MIELFGVGIMAGLVGLVIWLSKGSGYKEAIIEKNNVEKEIIEERKQKVWANKDIIARSTDAERAKLLKEFSRKL